MCNQLSIPLKDQAILEVFFKSLNKCVFVGHVSRGLIPDRKVNLNDNLKFKSN